MDAQYTSHSVQHLVGMKEALIIIIIKYYCSYYWEVRQVSMLALYHYDDILRKSVCKEERFISFMVSEVYVQGQQALLLWICDEAQYNDGEYIVEAGHRMTKKKREQ